MKVIELMNRMKLPRMGSWGVEEKRAYFLSVGAVALERDRMLARLPVAERLEWECWLGLAVGDLPTQSEVQQVVARLNELIDALRRV